MARNLVAPWGFWRGMLWAIVLFHFLLLFANLVAFIILPFYEPWYVALPVDCFLYRLMTVSSICPLTIYENRIRKILGIREIHTFIGHYITGTIRYKRWPN